jgi:hypothetical protein
VQGEVKQTRVCGADGFEASLEAAPEPLQRIAADVAGVLMRCVCPNSLLAQPDRIGDTIRRMVPTDEIDGIVDNIGLSVSGINMAYNNSGTIGVEDADILISLKPDHAPTDDYIKTMRQELPQQFPGVSFAFLPADMVSQILNFGAPAPIDLQVVGNDVQADRKFANALLSRIKQIPGIADARIQQAFQQPTLNISVDRSLAGLVGLSEKDADRDAHHIGGQLADFTNVLARSEDGRLLPGLGADAAARYRQHRRAAESAVDRGRRHRSRPAAAWWSRLNQAIAERCRRLPLQRPPRHRHLCNTTGA